MREWFGDWWPTLVIALLVVAGVVLGQVVQLVFRRTRFLTAATILTVIAGALLGVQSWREARAWHAALPYAGVIAGVLHHRHRWTSVFAKDG